MIFPLPMDLISAFQEGMKDIPGVVGGSGPGSGEVSGGDGEGSEPDPATDPGYRKPRLEDIERELGSE